MSEFAKSKTPPGFSSPTALPKSLEEARQWQEANRAWWEKHPMRYDFEKTLDVPEFSPEFYRHIDQRFFSDAKMFIPWKRIPFDKLIDFDELTRQDVLEIGVGSGSHAQLLAEHARSFVGIDLTAYAVKSTAERMRLRNLNVKIARMDAENMEFESNSFDFIWSWGVIHHSSNTKKLLQEIQRVLRPGGRAVTMVYHRNFWNYVIVSALLHGILQGGFLKTGSLHNTRQLWIDGAIARFYSVSEWKALVTEFFAVESIQVYGSKAELIVLPKGRIKDFALSIFPDQLSRFFTNRCRMGTFLVTVLRK
ncbi:MAG: class I SAM-dependent methyltransferase [Acidobacteriota bacterium]|nr:class I SAM-dependent methyltransferase [Acidobacteriota bacterium]